MRLNSDLITSSPAFFNALRERELDLRGNRIPAIENLGVTENGFDTIDLSENELTKLENFPFLPRLQTLMASKNKIRSIAPLDQALPNLTSLVLIDNDLATPQSIDVLAALPRLTRLAVMDNPMMGVPNARLYIIHKLPQVRVLDMQRVRQSERKQAQAMYGKSARVPKRARVLLNAAANPVAATTSASTTSANTSTATAAGSKTSKKSAREDGVTDAPVAKRARLSAADEAVLVSAIQNAKTVDEVQRLEAAMRDGVLPAGLTAN